MERRKRSVSNQLIAAHMKIIARKLLRELESAIENRPPAATGNDGNANKSNARIELLFGAKSPLINSLATLTDTLLKIDKLGSASGTPESEPPPEEGKVFLSEADERLVQNFIKRKKLREQEAALSPPDGFFTSK